MTKVLVLYYSSFGHIEQLVYAEAEGARSAGATVDVKRPPENVPEEVAKALHFKLGQPAPIAITGQMTLDEIVGGAPYGATTIAGAQGQRQPIKLELQGARHQGELVAKVAAKLSG